MTETPRRNTKQREAVRAALGVISGFVSAQELHALLRDQGSTIGLATVYRTLASLAANEEADSLQSPDGENLFRSCATPEHHHHLVCRQCGETRELKASLIEEWSQQVSAEFGFTDIHHVVDLFGVCAECQTGVNTPG